MTTTYNQIAGQSVERLAALSDGIFAVAMTLLVLDLHVPAVESIHTEHDLWRALVLLSPQLVMYLMTFMTLGIFWLGQQTQLNHLVGSHRSLAWLHIGFLFAVSIMPFLTRLLAEYPTYRLALIAYWLNIVVLGGMLYLSWVCALDLGLVKPELSPAASTAIKRRIVTAQALYTGAVLLCVVSTTASIAVIVLIQISYVFGLDFSRRATNPPPATPRQ
jgi:uncharacterized membrane protein